MIGATDDDEVGVASIKGKKKKKKKNLNIKVSMSMIMPGTPTQPVTHNSTEMNTIIEESERTPKKIEVVDIDVDAI